jgi:hypothetical protein
MKLKEKAAYRKDLHSPLVVRARRECVCGIISWLVLAQEIIIVVKRYQSILSNVEPHLPNTLV